MGGWVGGTYPVDLVMGGTGEDEVSRNGEDILWLVILGGGGGDDVATDTGAFWVGGWEGYGKVEEKEAI